jgi:hypothetical protein
MFMFLFDFVLLWFWRRLSPSSSRLPGRQQVRSRSFWAAWGWTLREIQDAK